MVNKGNSEAANVNIDENAETDLTSLVNEDIQNNFSASQSSEKSLMDPITSVGVTDPIQNIGIHNGAATHGMIFNQNDDFANEPSWLARTSLAIKGFISMQLYEGHGNALAPSPAWNDMGISVKHEFDPFHAVALEAGQETFPVYLANKDGKYDDHRSISWLGASYTYSFSTLEIFNIHPEARILTGISTAGPIAKFSAGLVFRTSSQISVAASPEVTSLFIKDHGTIKSGGKFGLTYSMIFHF
jgi:hypothetical protein